MFAITPVEKEVVGTGENLLYQLDGAGDLAPLRHLMGKVQCVYIDPPFRTGNHFTRRRRYGGKGWRTGSPVLSFPSYTDEFPSAYAYMDLLHRLIRNAHKLLSPTGVFYLHLDWHAAAIGRMVADEVFGADMFLNEIVWGYESGGRAQRFFSRKHDTILLYSKTRHYQFDLHRVPLSRQGRNNHMRRTVDENGRPCREIVSGGKTYRYYDDTPTYPSDVWTDISHLQQRTPERTGYPTQKPLKLLERLLLPVTKPGDWVVDLCCGSGTTAAAAQALGCRFATVDTEAEALLVTRNRLRCENITLVTRPVVDLSTLHAAYDRETGLVTLESLETPTAFPATDQVLDNVESWSAGYCREGVYQAAACLHRSHTHPDLPPMIFLPPGEGTVAVSLVDASGVRRVFQWRES